MARANAVSRKLNTAGLRKQTKPTGIGFIVRQRTDDTVEVTYAALNGDNAGRNRQLDKAAATLGSYDVERGDRTLTVR